MKNDKRIVGATGTVVDPNSKDDWANYFSMYNTHKSNMTYEEAASTYGTNINTFASAVPHVVASPGHDKVAQAQKMAYSQSRIVAEMEKYNKMWAQRMADTVEEETEFLMEVTDVDNIEMVDETLSDEHMDEPADGYELMNPFDGMPEDDFEIDRIGVADSSPVDDPYYEQAKLNPESEAEVEGVEITEDSDEPEYKIVDVNDTDSLGSVFGWRDNNTIEHYDDQPVEIDMIVPASIPYIETKITVDVDGSAKVVGEDGEIEPAVVVDCEPSESVEIKTEESLNAEENKAIEAKETSSESVQKDPVKKTSASVKKTTTASAKKPAAKKTAPKKIAAAKKASTSENAKKPSTVAKKTSSVSKTTKK